jgi:hypothetical protein
MNPATNFMTIAGPARIYGPASDRLAGPARFYGPASDRLAGPARFYGPARFLGPVNG